MTANEIREKFLNFFASKKHAIVESDSVVPKDDPTVLFTTAGMQQFKRQFLGHIDEYTRACTSQKCVRTDDLDEVGRTAFHHTFFEMLGNFSFGDYFKNDAIAWAWEFLTQELKLPADRLWVSVYKDDDEALVVWRDTIGIPTNRIFKLGDKSNFWPSNAKKNGPNGPCGPCSEIFYDYAPEKRTTPKDPDDEPGRFCEVWNLVFTQFNRKDGGELEPLPNKNIDTGMGLERLSAVLQGVTSNFETDLFTPILEAINSKLTINNAPDGRNLKYVIADHLRAIVFGINDGVVPSNEGRGYVLKKLIIDITDISIQSGQVKPTIYQLVPSVISAMAQGYPDLKSKEQSIADIVKNIEEGYIRVRKERLPEFTKMIKNTQDPASLGQIIFSYRDTYGLALNTIHSALAQTNCSPETLTKAWKEFDTLMANQQEKSRATSKMTGDVFTDAELDLSVPKTEFNGFDHAESTSTVLKMFVGQKATPEVQAETDVKIILDKSPFYAESGGQIGDTGTLQCNKRGCLVEIYDTQKRDDIIIHCGIVKEGTLGVDCLIKASIDVPRRLAIMRNHTATHLLQTALTEILGPHVQQQGSLVAEDRLRFDFTHPRAITQEELRHIENRVNFFIRECDTIEKEYLPIEQARKTGAKAFFAEKYGKTVRVVSIGNYSKEFCGGTHLGSTGQIGVFKISSESAIAQGIRRIEALTGTGAIASTQLTEDLLDEVRQRFKSTGPELMERIDQQQKRLKQMEKELASARLNSALAEIMPQITTTKNQETPAIICHTFINMKMDSLRGVVDAIKQRNPSYITILGAKTSDAGAILIAASNDWVKKGVHAQEIIKTITPEMNGNGGGRPQIAQAGTQSPEKIDAAITKALNLVNQKVAA